MRVVEETGQALELSQAQQQSFREEHAALVLCSRTRGRERWHVDVLEDNPRLAASVELLLRSEEGITEARANALTGRVLVYFNPEVVTASIEKLIERALSFGPMSRQEFKDLRSRQASSGTLAAAEAGCSALQMVALCGVCPLGLAAAALFFLFRGVAAGRCAHPA